MFFFDSTYIIVLPAIVIAIWAQIRVHSTFNKYKNVMVINGKSASYIVQQILSFNQLRHVKLERVEGHLTDHYDPRTKTLILSEEVYDSPSISAIGVAAHEAGHAIQDATGYGAIKVRNAIAPAVGIISWASFPLILLGFVFHSHFMLHLGIFVFSGVVIFQLITLPVEFDASARALKILKQGFFSHDEYLAAKKVLNAAAMTYIAAALTSILELVRLLILSRDD